jgi:hypothetical protein
VLWRSVGAEVIVTVPGRSDFELLSGSGGAVWRALGESLTMSDLVAVLAAEHGIDGATIEGDVRQLIGTLSVRGLVEEEAGG